MAFLKEERKKIKEKIRKSFRAQATGARKAYHQWRSHLAFLVSSVETVRATEVFCGLSREAQLSLCSEWQSSIQSCSGPLTNSHGALGSSRSSQGGFGNLCSWLSSKALP